MVKWLGNETLEKVSPFVLTYHLLFKSINKNLFLLYMNNEVKEVFTPKPTISFRSVSKKSSYLVRAKLYPEEKTKGSLDCGSKRSKVCLNVNETSTFASTVTSETYIIKYKFNCNDKCLVYLLTCDCCQKQYVGQTVDEFRFRWNSYKSNCRKHQRGETCMQQHLYEHFCSCNHNCFICDVSVTFIDKTDPSDPLKREDYWRSTLKIMALFGLNVEESCVKVSGFGTLAALHLERQCWVIRSDKNFLLGIVRI